MFTKFIGALFFVVISTAASASCLRYGDTVIVGEKVNGLGLQFLVAEQSGSANMNRAQPGPWEHFKVFNADQPGLKGAVFEGDKVALLSIHDKFLVAEQNGTVNANRVQIGPWEEWEIEEQHPVNPPASAIDRNACVGLSGGSASGSNQTTISLKSHLGTYLSRGGSGNIVLASTPTRLWAKATGGHASSFDMPAHIKNIGFLGDCDTKTVNSNYGPLEVCVFQPNEPIVVDLRGIAGEDRYHLNMSAFKQLPWVNAGTIFDNGSGVGSHELVPAHWVCTNCQAPELLIANDLMPNLFRPTIHPNQVSTGHDDIIYKLSIAIGPVWKVEHLFFDVESH